MPILYDVPERVPWRACVDVGVVMFQTEVWESAPSTEIAAVLSVFGLNTT